MKRILYKFILAVCMLLPLAANAQTHTITVANGTQTNNRVPVYGYYADSYNRCQTIYPASMLSAATTDVLMEGGEITSLTYYLQQSASSSWGSANFVVKMMEVSDESLTGFVSTEDAIEVYSGSLDGTQTTMTVTLSTPFPYQGGNLLIEVTNDVTGAYRDAYFYGTNTSNHASWQGDSYSGLSAIAGNHIDFIPKTTFSFTGGGGVSCYAVQNLRLSDVTSTTMTLTWRDTLNDSGVNYNIYNILNDSLIASGIGDTTYTVTGLTPNSLNGFKVEARCSDNDSSLRITVAGRTDCAEHALPFFEDFDSMPQNASPDCWHVMNGQVTIRENINFAHSGEKSLDFRGSLSNIIAMPGLTESLNGKQLYFYTRPENLDYRCGSLSVGYVTSLTDTSTFVSLAEYTLDLWDSPVVYHEAEVNYNDVPEGAYVAFRHNALHVNFFWYIDDVEIMDQPSCFRPSNVRLADATSSTVTLQWDDTLNAAGVTYCIYTWPDSVLVASGITGTSHTLTGLTSNTSYVYAVLTECSASDESRWYPKRVRTTCDTLSLPYSEGFETSPVGDHPLCWNHLTHVGDQNNYCNVHTTSPHGNSQRALKFNYGSPTGNVILMPELGGSLDDVRLRFWYKAESATHPGCGTLEVGYMTNDFDTSTYVPVDTLTQTSTYSRVTVSFPEAPSGSRIAFRHTASLENWYWVIDDVVVENMPDCADITHIGISSMTDTTVAIHWDATSAASYEAELYQNGTLVQSWSGSVNETVLAVTDGQDYSLVVRGICGSDTSEWSDPFAFHVGYCEPAPTSVDGQGITNVTYGVGTEVVNNNNHPTASPYYGNYSQHVGAFPAGVPAQVNLTFGTGYSYGTVIWIDWNQDMVFEDSEIVYTGTSLSNNPAMLQATFDIDYDQPLGYYRMRIGAGDYYFDNFINSGVGDHDPCVTGNPYSIFLDYTVHITEAPACMPALDLAVSDIQGDSATLSWNHYGTANYSIVSGDDTLASGITATTYTLTSLDLSTHYEVAVVSHCPDGNQTESAVVAFTTPCAPTVDLPFTESFEANSGTVGCWNYVSVNSVNGMGASNGMGFADFDGHRCLRFSSFNTAGNANNYHQYAYSPAFETANDNDSLDLRVRFATYGSGDQLFFGYVTDTDTVWGTQPYFTTSMSDIQFATIGIPGTANRIVVHYYGNYQWYAWVDSVSLEVVGQLTPSFNVTADWDATMGSVTGAGIYYEGANATLTAIPNAGYAFVGWQEGGVTVSTANPYTIAISADHALTALFQPLYTVTVNYDATMGSVTGAGTYDEGATVTLTATPNEGYAFVGWQEDNTTVSTTNPYTFTLTADRTLTALFEALPNSYTVTVNYDATKGNVTGAGTYNEGTSVTLTAVPNAGYVFSGWQESYTVVSTTNPYTFTLTANRTLTAVFTAVAPETYTVTVNYDATMGSVTGAGTFNEGTSVTLSATANDGYEFVGWQDGSVVVNDNPYTFTLTANRTLTAIFAAVGVTTYTVTVNYDATKGTVTGAGIYEEGASVSLSATANSGYEFVGWQEGTEMFTDNPYTFTATADRSFTAVFRTVQGPTQYTVTVNCDPAKGSVTGADTYDEGATVTLTATANSGYEFIGWLEGAELIEENPYSFTIASDRTFTAMFHTVTAIDEVENGNVTLYPNPATTSVTLEGMAEGSRVMLLDLNGRTNGEWKVENGKLTIDVSSMAKGAYFVRIVTPATTLVRKLIVR